MWVGGQRHDPAALPPGKIRYPFYRRLGGPQGQSGRMRKISPPPGFDPRTVKPVASRYTDCAIPAHKLDLIIMEFSLAENLCSPEEPNFSTYIKGNSPSCNGKKPLLFG